MNRFTLMAILAVLMILAAGSYYLFSPSQIDKRRAQELLQAFATAIETQKSETTNNLLNQVLAANAQVTLEIDFPSLSSGKDATAEAEKFNHDDFLRFVDNTLYTVTDSHLKAAVHRVTLEPGGKHGTVDFSASIQAVGMQMDGNLHFTGDVLCSSQMRFDKTGFPEIATLTCAMQLHYAAH